MNVEKIYFGLGLLLMVYSGHSADIQNQLNLLRDMLVDNPEQVLIETNKLF